MVRLEHHKIMYDRHLFSRCIFRNLLLQKLPLQRLALVLGAELVQLTTLIFGDRFLPHPVSSDALQIKFVVTVLWIGVKIFDAEVKCGVWSPVSLARSCYSSASNVLKTYEKNAAVVKVTVASITGRSYALQLCDRYCRAKELRHRAFQKDCI
jgi:hypothetical protein